MRICWFDGNRLGCIQGGSLFDITAALGALPAATYPAVPGDLLVANLDRLIPAVRAMDLRDPIDLASVRLLQPVMSPTKVIGVPANYHAHVDEANAASGVFDTRYQGTSIVDQGLFLKATSCLVGSSQGVTVRFPDRRTDHEMELALVIGRPCANVAEADWRDYVAGYTIGLDMVVRGTEDRSFRKSIDSYGVIGPWLVTADEIEDPSQLDIQLWLNGELRQSSNTRHLIMSIPEIIAWASRFYTLYPGDVIMTGTCAGVGQVRPGDVMTCEIEGIGRMDVPVH